jgi:1-acyl-sn-glycerol-3-phosphate acyltransferase
MIRRYFNYLRAAASLLFIGVITITGDLVQRTVFALLLRISGRYRTRLLVIWFRFWAKFFLVGISLFCGVNFKPLPRLPGDPGILVLMNHQSLLDMPYLVSGFTENYPLFVTRRSHARGIPLISRLLRMYKVPFVDPVRFSRSQLDGLRDTAANTQLPMAIFPEGTRSKDGEIRKFRTAGTNAILSSRPWSVYLVVVDGLWQCATLPDFLAKISQIKPKSAVFGPFPYDPETGDPEQFVAEMHALAVKELANLRRENGG